MITQLKDQSVSRRIDLNLIQKKKINIAVFGHGNVGSQLIDQILERRLEIAKRRNIDLNIFAIANSKTVLLSAEGAGENWRQLKTEKGSPYQIQEVLDFAKNHRLDNLILVDNTASGEFVKNYPLFVLHGFHLVSSNKIANTLSLDFYKNLRNKLTQKKRHYLYETNVGAGLPLIDTIKLLHLSGENITRIRGGIFRIAQLYFQCFL